jgi:ribosome maturation factor RimP
MPECRRKQGIERDDILAKRTDIEERTEALVQPIIEANDFELVDVEYVKEGANWYLRVYADKEGGINIDDCVLISRALEEKLDADDFIEEAYILEVSSPGLGRPLKKEKDYLRSIGKSIDVKLYQAINKQKEFTGILKEYSKDNIILTIDDEDITFETKSIASARLSLDF